MISTALRSARAKAEAANLIHAIEAAFRNIPRPQITLSVAHGLDDEWNLNPDRFRELRSKDQEEDWIELDEKRTEPYQEYFTFSDDENWRFYLPAFMCHYLRHFPGYGYDTVY